MGWNALSGSYARDVDARSLLEKLVNPSSKSEKAEEFLSGLDEELFIDLMEMLTSKMALVATVHYKYWIETKSSTINPHCHHR